MTNNGLKTIEIIYEIVRERFNMQFEQVDSMDAKAEPLTMLSLSDSSAR